MNYLWGGMILVGVIYGALTGRLDAVTDQALASAKEAVTLCITMAGVMAFWVGIMRIAERAGMVEQAARSLNPVMSFLFPNVPKNSPARTYIAMNMVANFLGLGWAATPAGLSAMKELEKLEEERRRGDVPPGISEEDRGKRKRRSLASDSAAVQRGVASSEMCTFLIINISSLQLIPVNIIAYRSQYGSVNPAAIVGPAIVATAVSTAVAVVFCKAMDKWNKIGS